MEAIKAKLNKVSFESDSKMAIQTIMEKISPPSVISDVVVDIPVLTSVVIDIQFLYCNKKANILANYLVKEADRCNIFPIWIINNIDSACVRKKGILLLLKEIETFLILCLSDSPSLSLSQRACTEWGRW